jgi:hypothetical protein
MPPSSINTSIRAYLDQFRGKADDWAIDLLDVAYNIEFGFLTEDQSSLAMVDFISTDMDKPFSMFGESDEKYRIKGGSSALIKALVDALQNKIDMKQGWGLTSLDYKDKKIVMGFDAPGGPQTQSFDAVILALPFTKLRQVTGLEKLKLGEDKLKTIRELGYGTNAKVIVGTTSRVWRSPDSGLPAPSNGSFYSDLRFQTLWSRAATSRVRRESSPISSGLYPASTTRSPRSRRFAKIFPRCRRRWQTASIRTPWSPGSGPPIPTRSAAMRAARSGSTRRCSRWRQSPLWAAVCNLPASTRAATSSAS